MAGLSRTDPRLVKWCGQGWPVVPQTDLHLVNQSSHEWLVLLSRMDPRETMPKTKNPAQGPGFVVDTHETRATAYPTEHPVNGRRARDVMPAAARALVSTVAV